MSKSCDRCYSTKLRCTFRDSVCDRCERLKVSCTRNRITKQRGRPSKKVLLDNLCVESFQTKAIRTCIQVSPVKLREDHLKRGSVNTRQRLSSARLKTGCVACKERHKKCNTIDSPCSYCISKGILCERPGARYEKMKTQNLVNASSYNDDHTHYPQLELQKNSDTNFLKIHSHLSPFNQLDDNESFLFQHFLTNTSFAVVAFPSKQRNIYLNTIVPMSMSQPAIWYALLSLSAEHCKSTIPRFHNILRQFHHQAIRHSYEYMATRHKHPEVVLSICLMLINNEIALNKLQKRSSLMDLASSIIKSNGGIQDFKRRSKNARDLIELFVYHDVMSSLTTGIPGLSGQDDSNPFRVKRKVHDESESEPDLFFGFAKDLFSHIIKLPSFSCYNSLSKDFSINDQVEYEAIEMALQSWQLPQEINDLLEQAKIKNLSEIENDGTDLLSLAESAIAIQWAGILMHHQMRNGYALDNPKVKVASQNIVEAISHIRMGSSLESLILFPLIMAALGGGDRSFILARFSSISSNLGFDHINTAVRFVREVWHNSDNGFYYNSNDKGFNWQRLLKEKYCHLSMV